MNKKIVTICIFIILLCVGLSGCNETQEELKSFQNSVTVIMEAIAQVVNSSGEPVFNVSVTFDVDINGKIHSSLVRTTDSTGWTSFAVVEFLIPLNEIASLTVYIPETGIIEKYSVSHKQAKENQVNNVYYWSLSARLVQ